MLTELEGREKGIGKTNPADGGLAPVAKQRVHQRTGAPVTALPVDHHLVSLVSSAPLSSPFISLYPFVALRVARECSARCPGDVVTSKAFFALFVRDMATGGLIASSVWLHAGSPRPL